MADNNKATSLDNVKQYVKGVLQGWFSNKATLDKLSTATNGDLLYNGNPVGSGSSVTVDAALSATSENPVQNKAIYSALQNISGGTPAIVDSELSSTSENPVQNKVIKVALDGKADVSAIPDVTGFVTQSAVSDALALKQDVLTFDSTPTENSANLVTSGGVYTAIQNMGGGSGSGYQLPIASQAVLGGVKVGAGLAIDSNGVLYVVGSPKSEGRIVLSSGLVELDPVTRSATVQILDSTGDIVIESSNEDVEVSLVGATISVTGTSADDVAIITVISSENGLYTSAVAKFHVGISIVTWADGTDLEIKSMLDAHYKGKINVQDYWSIGDERIVHLSAMGTSVGGEDVVQESHVEQDTTIVLVNFGGRVLADGTTECVAVWNQKHTLANGNTLEAGVINLTNSNAGGWRDCARRIWANNIFYNAFQDGFKGIIKESIVLTGTGYQSNSAVETRDYCFLPSVAEITSENNVPLGPTSGVVSGEGNQFEYFKYEQNCKKTANANSVSTVSYWTRSPGKSAVNRWYYQYINYAYTAPNNTGGISMCGCI